MADSEIQPDSDRISALEAALKTLQETTPFADVRAENARLGLVDSISESIVEIGFYPDDPQPGQLTNIRHQLLDSFLMSDPRAVTTALAFTDGAIVQRYRAAIEALTRIRPRDILIAPLEQTLARVDNEGNQHGEDFGWVCRGSLARVYAPDLDYESFDHVLLHELFHTGEGHDPGAEAYERWREERAMLEGAIETLCQELGPLTGPESSYHPEIGVIRLLARERGLTPVELAAQIWQSPRPLLTLAAHLQELDHEKALDQIAAQVDTLRQQLRPLAEDKPLDGFLAEVDQIQPQLSAFDATAPAQITDDSQARISL
jgi:hypothetical protein